MPGRGEDLPVRELRRQFESIVDRLAEELSLIHASSLDNTDQPAYHSALTEISAAFESPEITSSVQNYVLASVPTDIAGRFLSDIESRWKRAGIAQGAQRLGRSALELCCYAILAWSNAIPAPLSGGAAWVTLVSSTELIELSRRMLSQVRRAGISGIIGLARVISSQRRDLTSALGRMELFGLPVVDKRLRWVPIEISYLSARVALHSSQDQSVGVPLEELLQILVNARNRSMGRGTRLLIAGKAGSGKTTAAHWLAVQASQQRLKAFEAATRQALPLYVRLRDAIPNRAEPSDRILLSSDRLRDEVATNWLEECANDVDPLIILDGWDELAPDRRSVAYKWLQSLINRFPLGHIIVTSRPEGLVGDHFEALHFGRVDMIPLQPDDAQELARRWFQGLVTHLHSTPDFDLGLIEHAREDLLRDLVTPTISDMADSPLLISMLCCLYANGNTTAPDKRGELYDLVTSALIYGRERDRQSDSSIWSSYSRSQKYEILSSIAFHMSEHGTLQLHVRRPRNEAYTVPPLNELLAQALLDIGRSPAEAAELTPAILDRSIVLQRVADNEAEFAHKSIHDYFAAYALRNSEQLEAMFQMAESSGQWTLLPFVCHNAKRAVADAVVDWIVTKIGQSSGADRRAMQLILIECLGAAPPITRSIKLRAESTVAEMFPPRDENEAKSLAALGNSVITYLQHTSIEAKYRRLAIDTLSRIGSREALKALTGYAETATSSDIDALAAAWKRFDPTEYARRVLSLVPSEFGLTLSDETRLVAAAQLESVTRLTVRRAQFQGRPTARLGRISQLRELNIHDCSGLADLEWTTLLKSLKRLSILRGQGLDRLTQLGPATLWDLHLENLLVPQIDWMELLGRLPQLRTLWLQDLPSRDDVVPADAFSNMRRLRTLVIAGKARCQSLDFLLQNSQLTRACFGWYLSEGDVTNLTKCANLHHLDIQLVGDVSYAYQLASLTPLRSLRLHGAWPALMRKLASSLPMLVEAHFTSSDIGRLDELRLPPRVRKLSLSDCTLREEDIPIPSTRRRGVDGTLANIEEFRWYGSELRTLRFLEDMPRLRVLDVEDHGSLTSLAGLQSISPDCSVRLVGTPYGLDEEPVQTLRRRGNSVVYKPNYDTETDGFYVDLGGS